MMHWYSRIIVAVLALIAVRAGAAAAATNPYERQIARQLERLKSADIAERAGAAEALGFLRASSAAEALAEALRDKAPAVRREAAMALGWCGTRGQVPALLDALDDGDWIVRQSAHVALGNLTALDCTFDALAALAERQKMAQAWRMAWEKAATEPAARRLAGQLPMAHANLAHGCAVAASSTYKGPPEAITDGVSGTFWQTKNVPFPQHCTIDLGRRMEFRTVLIQQYGQGFCMTDYALATSEDGKEFKEAVRQRKLSPPQLVLTLPKTSARYIRIVSYASEKTVYPTTINDVQVYADEPKRAEAFDPWQAERDIRALGVLSGDGAADAVARAIAPYRTVTAREPAQKAIVQAGLRALGRLRATSHMALVAAFLDNPQWARYAAEALGDMGDTRAIAPLVAALPQYSRSLQGKDPQRVPVDDVPKLDPTDRMYETPYAIATALARLPLENDVDRTVVRGVVPLLLANLGGDYDGAMLYEPEAAKLVVAWLVERTGLLETACSVTFEAMGQPQTIADGPELANLRIAAARNAGNAPHASVWLPVLCLDKRYIPAHLALLNHANHWVRLNAAKALMFIGDARAIEPIAKMLTESKAEADFGYFGGFLFLAPHWGQDEYKDPTPRWREAFVRALGRLGAKQHVPLLVRLLNDERGALEIQYAAAVALDELGTPEALAALAQAKASHPYHSIRLVAAEALWRRSDRSPPATPAPLPPLASSDLPPSTPAASPAAALPDAIVFIKGDNVMPNRFQIDPWRQTYSTTDSGPTYRLGRNLFILRTAGNSVTPLTRFTDGYVADCEVSWDGQRILFARRGGDADPWWHVWEVSADGSNLRQLTRGPYHDVQPNYLPDGRIVFASSRTGMRDEYHGYPATGLTVMDGDGGNIRCIGFNLGRDNEPAILDDGRIVFSRLELFYSRLKTEINVEAVFPDGRHNVVLYGPERRDLWRQVSASSGENWWGEVPPRHRVLRLTQAQPMPDGRILCASTGGLVLLGPDRNREQFIPHDPDVAVTSPYPLDDKRILCSATKKGARREVKDRYPETPDLGLYTMDVATGQLTPLYNDPDTADFEARPLVARRRPPVLPDATSASADSFTGRLFCGSALISRDEAVRSRGRFVRIIEGMPIVGRHMTHTAPRGEAWKNHTGTLARVLGTAPLAPDGSFYVEVPADRLIHFQVLDSDRRVVGNQLIWMYVRPGETRGCIGCHELPDTAPPRPSRSSALSLTPVPCLPEGGEFNYRAKFWNKGILTDEGEERTRTVRAVNLIGRQ